MDKGLPQDVAVGDVFLYDTSLDKTLKKQYKVVVKSVSSDAVWVDWFEELEDGTFCRIYEDVREARRSLDYYTFVKIEPDRDLRRFL